MSQYYCRACAIALGYIDPNYFPPANLTGDAQGYQLDKFLKHTQLGYYTGGQTSLFSNPDYENYRTYILGTMLSGCVERDSQGRQNLVYWAGKEYWLLPRSRNGSRNLPGKRCESRPAQ